jgi:hypothetical protein
VRLAHQSLDTDSMIMVETHSRLLTDADAGQSGQRPLQSVAFAAAVDMVNLTLPVSSVPRPDGLLRALTEHAHRRGERYADWLPVAWQMKDGTVPGRAWRFAGGWAAFSDAMSDVYLAAAGGPATDPGGLAFAPLRNGNAYNFDLAQPLHPRTLAASNAARAGGERPPLQRQDRDHAQLELIRG